ncbi:putative ribonuclease H-like domain-containing protein, partial [Tanacetum coccineum]
NRDCTVSPSVSTAGQNFTNTNDLSIDPLIPDLEDTSIFSGAYDDKDVGAEADLNNLEITLNKVWILVDLPKGKHTIETKWVYRNKKDEKGIVVRNKERMVAQDGCEECLLYGTIKEEVYVCQPPGFEDLQFPDKVYKVEKALYGLNQAPRAWYETLSTYLLENRFRKGVIDKTLFIKKSKGDILLVQVYVDDIIFGSTTKSLCIEFEGLMHKKFQISSMGELTFFLGLQVMQRDDVTPKVSHLYAVKRIFRYLKGQTKLGLWYPRDLPFNLEAFSDSDYAGASLDRKSTIGGCQFLGKRLISWQCKKQTIVANSTTEAEYVAASNCYGRVLWIQNQMLDYGFNFMNTKIYIDNESTICIVKNLVFHSKTKHIEIRHHFIRDSYEKKLIQVIKIHTDHNVADLLTKAFDVSSTAEPKLAAEPKLVLFVTVGDNTAEGVNSKITVSSLVVDFLTTSSIHYALTVSPTIYASYIEQFWATAKSKTVNDVKQIHATVDGKTVVISESSVRSDLHFNDEDGITCLSNDEIFVNLALMGYERVSTKLTFQKAFFSPQWKYLIHTILHCLSSKTTAWNEFSTNLASTVICLAKGQKFNFSKLIFDGMLRNLDSTSKKFLMYLRFLQLFLNNQIALAEPFNDIYVTPIHTKKVFTNMKRQNKDFSGRITPLFASMLVPQVVEGEGSGQPSEPQPPSSTAPPSQVTTVATQHQKTHKPRRAKRGRDTKIPQSSGPPKKVVDKVCLSGDDAKAV